MEFHAAKYAREDLQDKPINKFASADLRYDLSGEICEGCLFSICRGLSDGGGLGLKLLAAGGAL